MSQIADLFKPEIVFSMKNPFFKAAEKSHRLMFETFDKAAHLQLAFCEDMLDLNRKRFDSLYAGDNLQDKVAIHRDLTTEVGKRTASLVGDMREVAVDLQTGISDAANEIVSPVVTKAPASNAKKAKAA